MGSAKLSGVRLVQLLLAGHMSEEFIKTPEQIPEQIPEFSLFKFMIAKDIMLVSKQKANSI